MTSQRTDDCNEDDAYDRTNTHDGDCDEDTSSIKILCNRRLVGDLGDLYSVLN